MNDPLAISTSCIDFQNNVIVATSEVVLGQDANIHIVKYDQAGAIIWQQSYNGTSNGKDYATSVKTNLNGDVFVIGTTFSNVSNYDYILLKYNQYGVLQWNAVFNGTGNALDIPSALVIDNIGNIYVTGVSVGVNSLTDYLTIKYSNSGNLIWNSYYDYAQGYEAPVGVEINPSTNSVYVTGASANSSSSNNYNITTVEYDNLGNQINVNRLPSSGTGLDEPTAICRDNSGNLYIVDSNIYIKILI